MCSLLDIGFRISRGSDEVAAIRCDQSFVRIGRASSVQVVLDDASVGRIHCIVETRPHPTIIDLGSTSGTFVNGQKVNKCALHVGDRITIGVFTLEVVTAEQGWATTIAPSSRGDVVTPATRITAKRQRRVSELPAIVQRQPPSSDELPPELAYLEAIPKQSQHVPAQATPSVPEQLVLKDALERISQDDRAFADHIGTMAIVVIDKLREHRGRADEPGKAYASMLEALGMLRVPRAAPSLLIELAHGMPTIDHDWRPIFAASIAHHDATWPHLMALADLPGFARHCAIAAVSAGRDPLPWLAHPFGEVRAAAAQAIRDPEERRRACASVWASYAEADHEPRFDWQAAFDSETAPLLDLPPIGPLVDGLFSDCADQRASTIEQVAARQARGEVYALVVADELDAARAGWGWPRTRVDWALTAGVPPDAKERARWIRAQARTRPDDLAPIVHAQLAYAPREYAPPKLVLSEDAYEALEDQERCEALAALTELEALSRTVAATG